MSGDWMGIELEGEGQTSCGNGDAAVFVRAAVRCNASVSDTDASERMFVCTAVMQRGTFAVHV